MPPASPTPPRRAREHFARRCGTASELNQGRRRWRDCLDAPRPAILVPRAAPRHRRLPAWCVCVTHRGCLGASHRCLRPPPTRPSAWEASVGGVRGFR
ncbi:hypothetical protein Ctob_015803, partial [Chrysochromulina tobinii]